MRKKTPTLREGSHRLMKWAMPDAETSWESQTCCKVAGRNNTHAQKLQVPPSDKTIFRTECMALFRSATKTMQLMLPMLLSELHWKQFDFLYRVSKVSKLGHMQLAVVDYQILHQRQCCKNREIIPCHLGQISYVRSTRDVQLTRWAPKPRRRRKSRKPLFERQKRRYRHHLEVTCQHEKPDASKMDIPSRTTKSHHQFQTLFGISHLEPSV